MTSKDETQEAYVWIWLPNEVKPVVAGLLTKFENQILFNYGKSYLSRPNAIAIYNPELPLTSGTLSLLPNMSMPSSIRDASPDAWGRRVIINKKLGIKGRDTENSQLDELTYLLESGSDRIGALDFQLSPTNYVPRGPRMATLEELLQSAEKVEAGILLSPELDQALYHGSSLGGARPKAFIESENKKFIAKFSSSTDIYSIVKAEFVAMRLAKIAGLDVASVKLAKAAHKDILLVERFDRKKTEDGWTRKAMVSALTMLELDEMMARYASYQDLAEIIRHRFTSPTKTLKELFGRIVFNILCGNTDDHARNHAAFWDGNALTLTPAYDICPQNRSGNEASQAMIITQSNRMSRLDVCIEAAPFFLLSTDNAKQIIAHQKKAINTHWERVCDEANLTEIDRAYFWKRQFLNPYIFEESP
jgi:serine/threonine-protein kinase HipA